jgi:hypothetical protein
MTNPVNKVIKNSRVAVIYSPGYGAGWSTWNDTYKDFLMFDSGLVDLIESNQEHLIREYIDKVLPDNNIYVSEDRLSLEIAWLPVGTQFRIKEYDGSESVVLNSDSYWEVA